MRKTLLALSLLSAAASSQAAIDIYNVCDNGSLYCTGSASYAGYVRDDAVVTGQGLEWINWGAMANMHFGGIEASYVMTEEYPDFRLATTSEISQLMSDFEGQAYLFTEVFGYTYSELDLPYYDYPYAYAESYALYDTGYGWGHAGMTFGGIGTDGYIWPNSSSFGPARDQSPDPLVGEGRSALALVRSINVHSAPEISTSSMGLAGGLLLALMAVFRERKVQNH